MQQTRRAILVGAGATLTVGLAGCGSGDGDGDDGETGANPAATEDEDETEAATPAIETIVDEQLHLREGSFESWQFYVSGEFTLDFEYTVTEGSPIDVYVVENRQLNPFESQVAFDAVASSEGRQSDEVSVDVPEGTYHFIVDHSDRGATSPPGGLTQDPVDVQVTATYEQHS